MNDTSPVADGAQPRPQGSAQELTWQLLGLLANVTVLTALLVYFGWRRAETQAHRMGFDESLLGMSTQDYLLRSIGPLLPLLLTIAAVGLAWQWADRRITSSIARRGRLARWWPRFALALGLALAPAVYLSPPWWSETAFVLWPLAIGCGILLLVYSGTLRSRLRGEGTPALSRVFVLLAAGVCLFWAASNEAEVLGNELADQFQRALPSAVQVSVYASERLYLRGPGLVEEKLPGEDGAYQYRYSGLRLLDHIGDRYFLVSDGWSPGHGVVIALSERDTLRFEFSSGT
jgi:hypothetical protein